MSCVLRAVGSEFDVDAFLKSSELSSCKVFRKGEPRFKTQPQGKVSQRSGFNADVSWAEFDDLSGQIEDAILFLEKYETEIKRLVGYAGAEEVGLDFAIEQRDVFVQSDSFPSKLLLVCGQLGLEITVSRYIKAAD